MSIATITLRYGWKIVAGAVLTGATIYVASNVPSYIYQRDVVEIVLGVTERCLATQTGTNIDGSGIYGVAPPSVIRSWTTTNGLTGTNFAWVSEQVTNTLSWYTDRAMMVDLDAKIFALIPCYADTNTVYEGTTNISMLTVTGLFASLQIGDHTNQFTAIPAIGTNSATFGPWARRNYRVAWEERYKVLNALKHLPASIVLSNEYYFGDSGYIGAEYYAYPPDPNYPWTDEDRRSAIDLYWGSSVAACDEMAATNVLNDGPLMCASYGNTTYYAYRPEIYFTTYSTSLKREIKTLFLSFNNYSEMTGTVTFFTKAAKFNWISWIWTNVYDAGSYPNEIEGLFYEWASFSVTSNSVSDSTFSGMGGNFQCDQPLENAGSSVRGFVVSDTYSIFSPQFNYCASKYW